MSRMPCPEPAALRAYQRGSLDAAAASTIAEHLHACPQCRAAVEMGMARTEAWRPSLPQPGAAEQVSGGLKGDADMHATGSMPGGAADAPQAPPLPAADSSLVAAPYKDSLPEPLRPSAPDGGKQQAVPAPPGYELLEEIGRGGMGVVYRARHAALEREVAVKLVHERYGPGSEALARFVAEARITSQLAHPGIPPVHELGRLRDGRPFLAMRLVKGHTLAQLLQARTDPQQDFGRFLAIFEQVCQAVGYAHARGVIHRDLKPSNVMVGPFGEVQVMDWGLAKLLGPSPANETAGAALAVESAQSTETSGPGPANETARAASKETHPPLTPIWSQRDPGSATQTGDILGTPAYMAPEQAAGEIARVDTRSDVFSLGAMLCELLTGQTPYVAQDGQQPAEVPWTVRM